LPHKVLFPTTRVLYFQDHLYLEPSIDFLFTECDMGCCFSNPVDFDGEVTLYHFDLLRAVGKGAFGKVFMSHFTLLCLVRSPLSEQVRVVQHKRSKNIYALKYIDKGRCLRQKAVANIIQERRLLEEVGFLWSYDINSLIISLQIDHPYIVNLRYAFQDDENCFFVLDLMLGGDLRCTLRVLLREPIPNQ
jgi:serine/threonine kinase 32